MIFFITKIKQNAIIIQLFMLDWANITSCTTKLKTYFSFLDLLPRTSLMIQVKPKIYWEAFKMQQGPMQIFF